jgi:glutathione S-transferase
MIDLYMWGTSNGQRASVTLAEFVADELSIADLMLYPNYAARKPLIDAAGDYSNLHRWGAMMASRPGVQKGMNP